MLLVTSSRRPDNWIVPGGGVEANEDPACTAVREVHEEAGVVGTLGRCLGMFEVSILQANDAFNAIHLTNMHLLCTEFRA